jgi:hypothetical protein
MCRCRDGWNVWCKNTWKMGILFNFQVMTFIRVITGAFPVTQHLLWFFFLSKIAIYSASCHAKMLCAYSTIISTPSETGKLVHQIIFSII